MKSIAYITGYTFGTAKSLISRIPQPDVDQIKADFKQAIADQQQPKPEPTFYELIKDPQLQAFLEHPDSAEFLEHLDTKHPMFADFAASLKHRKT